MLRWLSSIPIRHFPSTVVVTSHKINACSMFASQACLHVSMAPRLWDQLNTKDADMERVAFMLRHYQSAGDMPYTHLFYVGTS